MDRLPEIDEFEIEKGQIKGFSRTLKEVEWLLMVLVILYMEIPGSSLQDEPTITLALISFAVFIFFFHYWGLHKIHNKWKIVIETWAMIAFITLVIWHTGKIESPLLSMYYLVIIITASILGKAITFLEVGLISACCLYLSFSPAAITTLSLTQVNQSLIQLFPLWLVAYLAGMLSGDAASAQKKMKFLSQTDDLTGLLNMRMFSFLAEQESTRAARYNRSYSILMLDADNLKPINDSYGHAAGGSLIKLIGKILWNNLRSADIIARYGGDEFVVLLPEVKSDRAANVGERIRKAIENMPLVVSGKNVFATVSIGIASYPEHGTEIKEVINNADKALYKSKKEGKNMFTVFSNR
jgi:diguanylate cyclase (GGDEF)-like protein